MIQMLRTLIRTGPIVILAVSPGVQAASSRVVRTAPGAWMVADDGGAWAGGSPGITHQVSPGYEAKKILDLGGVPQSVWRETAEVRLSLFFCVRDYSWHDLPKKNGLDEAFEIVVNGRVHRFPTNGGFPVYKEGKSVADSMRWHDLRLPKADLVRGANTFVFRKTPPPAGKKTCDDYFYLGIDNSVPPRNSWVRFVGSDTWRQDKLTIPGTTGEYMVRIYLLSASRTFAAVWAPAHDGAPERRDPWFLYAGTHGPDARLEWDPARLDPMAAVDVTVEGRNGAALQVAWLDAQGQRARAKPVKAVNNGRAVLHLDTPWPFRPCGVAMAKSAPVRRITVRGVRGYHPAPRRIDMAPSMKSPRGKPVRRSPACDLGREGRVRLENATLRCELRTTAQKRLRLGSLYNEWAQSEMVDNAADSALFMIEVAGKRYAGSRDFHVISTAKLSDKFGVRFLLRGDSVPLEADLRVWVDADDLRMALALTNRGTEPLAFKSAFPHLSGLRISQDPAADYYFFPWGGGIIADVSTVIRRGYGDNEAYYQVMDLFSPERGAGLLVRCTDDDGRYKVLALRKFVPGLPAINGDDCRAPTTDEFKWSNSLPRVLGIGFTFEYLRRTRAPRASFELKPVALQAHAGDWHRAMAVYAAWAHRVWRFRPYPSRLDRVVTMIAAGWGPSFLFKDGRYRTDIVKPMTDCIELMSWWDWSPVGPFSTPMDRLKEVMTERQIKRWKGYFVKDPVTGKTMWNNQPGDYKGYNERFGGLPAFRQAIRTYGRMGALVTLYTDPFRLDDNCEIGRKYGKKWGVVLSNGKHSKAYLVWNPCHDCPEVREWVARTMKRVMQETGADGIRLDEYGHKGWACFSRQHKHTFAEWGCTEWQRAVAEATKMIHAGMDEVRPNLVLTTEHPGYDFLMQYLEGCITYDLTVEATPLRPLECNLQRFYFPECKAYELDHRRADLLHRKRFWNAVGSFGSYYPEVMYHAMHENDDAFAARDATPLLPSASKYVYVNRFRTPDGVKSIYTVYNATGHSFFGPAAKVEIGKDRHVADLLSGRELRTSADGVIETFIERDGVRAFVVLPRAIRGIRRKGGQLVVKIETAPAGTRVAACNADGKVLRTAAAINGESRLDLAGLIDSPEQKPVLVKLLSGRFLVDLARIPDES
ncbi:MAG: hypothetical protein GXP31_16280 [Kiritimatiellaeota bacterium]|nr:hypothetical protein [Kiritimatiellota bacterium]